MEHGGFLESRKINPLTLGLIIAGHGVVLTAIILSPPDTFKPVTWFPTHLISIRDQPPPPAEVPPPAQPRATHTAKIEVPKQLVATQPTSDSGLTVTPPQLTFTTTTKTVDISPPARLDPVFVGATMDPGAAARVQPDYPPALARAEIEGTATVRILIGTDGHVKQVEMVSATDPGFFEATRKQALRYWQFRPATSDGMPTESWRTMTVRFRLQS